MKNEIKVENGIVKMVVLRQATGEKFIAEFDVEDIEKVSQYDTWRVRKGENFVYTQIEGTTKNIHLHRIINNTPARKQTGAVDESFFNCKRNNLYTKIKGELQNETL